MTPVQVQLQPDGTATVEPATRHVTVNPEPVPMSPATVRRLWRLERLSYLEPLELPGEGGRWKGAFGWLAIVLFVALVRGCV